MKFLPFLMASRLLWKLVIGNEFYLMTVGFIYKKGSHKGRPCI